MEMFFNFIWNIYRKEESMAIRGYTSGKTDTTYYANGQVRSIVKELGLDITGEASNNLIAFCPLHNNKHTPSFSISCETGLWLCYNPSCGEAGTLIELIKRLSDKNEFQALRMIMSAQSEAYNNFDDTLSSMFEEKPEFELFPQETLDNLFNGLKNSQKAKDYLMSRGIKFEAMDYFKLGYSENMDMVITPVHSPDGEPIGLVGRSIEGKRFKNSSNLPKSKTLFNIHRAKKIGDHVIIVESNFDAIRIHQAGFPNVVATLGGSISPEHIRLLNRYFSKITIMTDADQAGRELGNAIANKLKFKNILWASEGYGKIYPHNAKDAGDMTDEEIVFCIKNAVPDVEYRTWNL